MAGLHAVHQRRAEGRDWRFTRLFAERLPDKSAPIVVGCKTGGDIGMEPIRIETDPSTGRTRQVIPEGSSQYGDKSKSNSLMAIYELQQAGYTNLYHLDGGVTKWCVDGEQHQGDPYKFYFHPTICPASCSSSSWWRASWFDRTWLT